MIDKTMRGNRMIDLTGKKYGELTVIEFSHSGKQKSLYWKCRCNCGNEVIINGANLRRGNTKSCGCIHKKRSTKWAKTMYNNRKDKDFKEGTALQSLTMKTPKTNTSGYKGVSWHKKRGKWRAYIGFKSKRIYLGLYKNIEDAIKARKEAEEKYFKPILEKYNKEQDMKAGTIIKNGFVVDGNPLKYSIYTGKRRGKHSICLYLLKNSLEEVEYDLRHDKLEEVGESEGWEIMKEELNDLKE